MLPEEGLSRSLELLARELSLQQIAHISQNTRVPLEKHLHLRDATDQCPKENPGASAAPLLLKSGKNNYRLIFDCKNCEMQVFTQD